jgi:hypothetical protein
VRGTRSIWLLVFLFSVLTSLIILLSGSVDSIFRYFYPNPLWKITTSINRGVFVLWSSIVWWLDFAVAKLFVVFC